MNLSILRNVKTLLDPVRHSENISEASRAISEYAFSLPLLRIGFVGSIGLPSKRTIYGFLLKGMILALSIFILFQGVAQIPGSYKTSSKVYNGTVNANITHIAFQNNKLTKAHPQQQCLYNYSFMINGTTYRGQTHTTTTLCTGMVNTPIKVGYQKANPAKNLPEHEMSSVVGQITVAILIGFGTLIICWLLLKNLLLIGYGLFLFMKNMRFVWKYKRQASTAIRGQIEERVKRIQNGNTSLPPTISEQLQVLKTRAMLSKVLSVEICSILSSYTAFGLKRRAFIA